MPSDAQVVDRTWKFVSKKGGPGKRFKDNRELPIALYEEIDFRSATGLNEHVQASKVCVGGSIATAIEALSRYVAAPR